MSGGRQKDLRFCPVSSPGAASAPRLGAASRPLRNPDATARSQAVSPPTLPAGQRPCRLIWNQRQLPRAPGQHRSVILSGLAGVREDGPEGGPHGAQRSGLMSRSSAPPQGRVGFKERRGQATGTAPGWRVQGLRDRRRTEQGGSACARKGPHLRPSAQPRLRSPRLCSLHRTNSTQNPAC